MDIRIPTHLQRTYNTSSEEMPHPARFPSAVKLRGEYWGKTGSIVTINLCPPYRAIPIVILVTSEEEEDIEYCYACGADTCVINPSSYEELKKNMEAFVIFRFEVVVLKSSL